MRGGAAEVVAKAWLGMVGEGPRIDEQRLAKGAERDRQTIGMAMRRGFEIAERTAVDEERPIAARIAKERETRFRKEPRAQYGALWSQGVKARAAGGPEEHGGLAGEGRHRRQHPIMPF